MPTPDPAGGDGGIVDVGRGLIGGILSALGKFANERQIEGVDFGFENRNGQTVHTPIIPGTRFS